LPGLRKVSGEETVKIICNKFGFNISGQHLLVVEGQRFYRLYKLLKLDFATASVIVLSLNHDYFPI
jgi:hypothetical protein